ncbi:MAG: AAA family ATPase [candidate division Zixibacteria bacterium]|nr:AAA family ATPase [candidate division Zixibacteria bacterium]
MQEIESMMEDQGLDAANNTFSNRDSLGEFLEVLFPELRGGFVEVRCISEEQAYSTFFNDLNELENWYDKTLRIEQSVDIYFGVCPRSERQGSKDAIRQVSCLWADVDAKDFNGGKDEALRRIHEFHINPAVIVDSGNGYHVYWRLKEPESIGSVEDQQKLESYLKALATALNADPSAAELARILRLPGTFNYKDPVKPLPVRIIQINPEQQCNLDDFDQFLPPDSAQTETKSNKPSWLAESLNGLSEGNRNTTFAKITGRLLRSGLGQDDIIALLAPHSEKVGFPIIELRNEVIGLCQRYSNGKSFTFPVHPYIEKELETETFELKTVTAEDLLAQEDLKISWVAEPFIPDSGVAIIAAPAGYGKTWMLLDLAIEVARGGKWLGEFQCRSGKVLYIDEESTPALLKTRLKKLLKFKILDSDSLEIEFAVGQGVSLTIESCLNVLRAKISSMRPTLIVIDCLIRVHQAEENSSTAMAQVFRIVKNIIREFDCAIVFADHQRKPGQYQVGLDQMLRGTSEKAAFVDTLLSLKRKGGELIVEHSKSRYCEAYPSFLLQINDPSPDSTAVLHCGDASEAMKRDRSEKATSFIQEQLSANGQWLSKIEILEAAKCAGVHRNAITDALKELVKDRILDRDDRKLTEGRGGKQAFYRVSEVGE